MDLTERFRYIMKLNNLSASAFADEIGVQRSSVSHILSGRNKPSLEFIQKIITRYPKIDIGWLINGTTTIPSNKDSDQQNIEPKRPKKEENEPKTVKITQNDERIDGKKIERIVLFYSDNTFQEFKP